MPSRVIEKRRKRDRLRRRQNCMSQGLTFRCSVVGRRQEGCRSWQSHGRHWSMLFAGRCGTGAVAVAIAVAAAVAPVGSATPLVLVRIGAIRKCSADALEVLFGLAKLRSGHGKALWWSTVKRSERKTGSVRSVRLRSKCQTTARGVILLLTAITKEWTERIVFAHLVELLQKGAVEAAWCPCSSSREEVYRTQFKGRKQGR